MKGAQGARLKGRQKTEYTGVNPSTWLRAVSLSNGPQDDGLAMPSALEKITAQKVDYFF
jgi:hypothetical protein